MGKLKYNTIDALQADIDKGVKIFDGTLTEEEKSNVRENIGAGQGKNKLRILAVGNSFTYDGVWNLANFIQKSGKSDNITIYYVGLGGSSLEFWSEVAEGGKAINTYSYAGSTPTISNKIGEDLGLTADNTLAEVFAKGWDILVIQQVSAYYVDYDTYKPHLTKLLMQFDKNCPNNDYKLAWQIVWSRGADSSSPDELKLVQGWENIISATRQFVADFGRKFDIIIPTGTAVQNARTSSVVPTDVKEGHTSSGDLTRDWHHLAHGAGVWLAGACWYESLISKFNGVSLWDFDYTLGVTPSVAEDDWNNKGCMAIPVTSDNIQTLKKAVMYAMQNAYEVVEIHDAPAPTTGEPVKVYVGKPANSTTGKISNNSGWIWLAGVDKPIDNTEGNIVKLNVAFSDIETIIPIATVFGFTEYNDTSGVYTLCSTFGTNGKMQKNAESEVTSFDIPSEVKYITLRLQRGASSASPIADILDLNNGVTIEKIDL